jgi:hypothetical protein
LPEVDFINPGTTRQESKPVTISYTNVSVQSTTPKSDAVSPTVTVKCMEWPATRHDSAQKKMNRFSEELVEVVEVNTVVFH